jgi:hypothetical protein
LFIGDFGLVKELDKSFTSTIAGTLRYMAPEVLSTRHYDFAADVWSMGCIFYEMINLYLERNMYMEVYMHDNFHDDIVDEITTNRNYSLNLAILVRDMLAKRSVARPTAEAVLHRLKSLLSDEEQAIQTDEIPPVIAIVGATSIIESKQLVRMYSFGYNMFSQLCVDKEADKIKKPTAVSIPTNLTIKKVIGGGEFTIILTGMFLYDICFIVDDGMLFSAGKNGTGQLGLGKLCNKVTILEHISSISNALDVAAGDDHTLCVTGTTDLSIVFNLYLAPGHVYSFGHNQKGQLGHGDKTTRHTPTMIQALDGIIVKTVACGFTHSAAITDHGDLYMWGNNTTCQIGITNTTTKLAPVKLAMLTQIVKVALGESHSAALDSNDLFNIINLS